LPAAGENGAGIVPLETKDLKDIVDRIRQGDAQAETEVVLQFTQRIFVMSFVRTRDREAARDLVQEVLMAVIGALRKGQLQDPEKLPAFIHGTARNLINNQRRDMKQHPPFEPLPEELSQDSLVGQLEEAERVRLVHQALAQLGSEDRKILRMTLVEGRKPADIASILKLSSDVVRTRKLRALRKVHEVIQKRIVTKPGKPAT
jgi:RNA polymerase sigma factor (sigma-70 family)